MVWTEEVGEKFYPVSLADNAKATVLPRVPTGRRFVILICAAITLPLAGEYLECRAFPTAIQSYGLEHDARRWRQQSNSG
jgi:hypothetical protein